MTWQIAKIDGTDQIGERLYGMMKQHRLVPHDAVLAVAMIRGMCQNSIIWEVSKDEITSAIVVLSSIFEGEQAHLDFLITEPRHFAANEQADFAAAFADDLQAAVDNYDLRRLTCTVPASRSRTKKLALALGFAVEGRMIAAFRPQNKTPEDVWVLGKVKEA